MFVEGSRNWSVESNEFEMLIKGGDSGVRIYERSKKKKSSIFVRRDELTWLMGALEEVAEVETFEVFWDQSRAGFPQLITQKCSNRHGRFLMIEESDGRTSMEPLLRKPLDLNHLMHSWQQQPLQLPYLYQVPREFVLCLLLAVQD
jgi:hypothetical protein